MAGRQWSKADDATLRRLVGKETYAVIAAGLKRTTRACYMRAHVLGLARRQHRRWKTPAFRRFLRAKHRLGWTDTEIASAFGVYREYATRVRGELALPSNKCSPHRRRTVAARTRAQCAKAGVPTLAALRSKVFREYARAQGWPQDLPPRCVQILNTIWKFGPMTRREIAAVIGMPWKGVKKTMVGSVPGGSYPAYLMRRGLVISLGRRKYNGAQGKNTCIYSLPLDIERRKIVDGVRTPLVARGRRPHCRSHTQEQPHVKRPDDKRPRRAAALAGGDAAGRHGGRDHRGRQGHRRKTG